RTRVPVLQAEPDLPDEVEAAADQLDDLLRRELFFQSLPDIERHAEALCQAYRERFDHAVAERTEAYAEALAELRATPGWDELGDADQEAVAEPLALYAAGADPGVPLPQLRA